MRSVKTLAAKEGSVAVNNAFNRKKKQIDLSEVPKAVFTYPEVASVGLTEEEANSKGIGCTCGILPFDLIPKAHVIGDTRGVVKLVADNKSKRVVGLHLIAPHAADRRRHNRHRACLSYVIGINQARGPVVLQRCWETELLR